jgi:hypothetical protein
VQAVVFHKAIVSAYIFLTDALSITSVNGSAFTNHLSISKSGKVLQANLVLKPLMQVRFDASLI